MRLYLELLASWRSAFPSPEFGLQLLWCSLGWQYSRMTCNPHVGCQFEPQHLLTIVSYADLFHGIPRLPAGGGGIAKNGVVFQRIMATEEGNKTILQDAENLVCVETLLLLLSNIYICIVFIQCRRDRSYGFICRASAKNLRSFSA